MKRRTFVQSGVASALGLALQPTFLPLNITDKQDIHSWLRQFSKSIQSRHFWAQRIVSGPDLQKMNALNQYFAQRFFHRENSSVYMIDNTDVSHLFYPVYLRHAQAGVCDVLLPVFTRRSNQSWQYTGTFNGFQLEALAHTAARLKEQAAYMGALLLPVSPGKTEGPVFTYTSALGSVSISTIVREEATTTVRVFQGNNLLLEDSFVSRHCLKGSRG